MKKAHHWTPKDPGHVLQALEHALLTGRISRRGFIRAASGAGLASTGLHALADELDAIRGGA